MLFILISSLWWTSCVITKLMKVGVRNEYSPSVVYIILIVSILPATLGVFIYPIFEIIWGTFSILSVISYSIVSLVIGTIFGNVIFRVLYLSDNIFFVSLINPLAMILSISGLIIMIFNI